MLGASATPTVLKSAEAENAASQIYDVLIIGAGTAGCVAAIQSARLGAKTLLLEASGIAGGTITLGGVKKPGIFHAWGKQVIAGIGWELVQKTVNLGGETLPDFSTPPKAHYLHQIDLNGSLYACIAEEEIVKSKAEILYCAIPQKISAKNGMWEVAVASKDEPFTVLAKQIIDASGNASAAALAGFKRLREAEVQPGTLIFSFTNYNIEDVDRSVLEANYEAAKKTGELLKADCYSGIYSFLRRGGHNQEHVMNADNSTSFAQTKTNIAGRASLLRLLRFFKKQKGLENIKIAYMQTDTAVRETYRIAGKTVVSVQDYVSAKKFDDAFAYAFYPVDLHTETGVKPERLQQGLVPTMPFSALIPDGSENFLVAGRSISSDRLANSALRVQACCMAMGQAAGAAAAMSALNGEKLSNLNFADFKGVLEKFSAIVP